VLVPYGREDVVARLYRTGEVLEHEETETGTRLHARIAERELPGVRDLLVHPVRREISAAP
jgi:hypothetical protein